MSLPKDFIDEVEVVSNVQDFTDVDSESAETFRGADPHNVMHYLSPAEAQGLGANNSTGWIDCARFWRHGKPPYG